MERSLRSRKKICSTNDSKGKDVKKCLINEGSTIEILNDDCLLNVFEYLPISDRIRLERVNKRWFVVSRMSWKSFKTLTFTSKLWGSQAVITRKALKDVLYLCGEYLQVWDMSEISVMLAENIYAQSVLQFCPNLTSVDFTSVKVGVPLISSLVKNCKNIVILNLGTITHATSEWFTNGTVLSTYTNLQVLNIESENVFISFIRSALSGDWIKFKNNNSIRELRLDCCLQLDESNLTTVVPKLTNLHTLSLRGSLERWNIPWNFDFVRLSNIKVLDISSNPTCVNDLFLIENASAFTRLKSLFIGDNYRITDNGLKSAIFSSNFEYLNIDGLNIEGDSLSDLPDLKGLSCRECPSLEAKRLQSLFSTSDKLEFIDLRDIGVTSRLCRIIIFAISLIKLRTSSITLSMYIDRIPFLPFELDIPDNLKLLKLQSDKDPPNLKELTKN